MCSGGDTIPDNTDLALSDGVSGQERNGKKAK